MSRSFPSGTHTVLKFRTIRFTYFAIFHLASTSALAVYRQRQQHTKKWCQESNTKNPSFFLTFFVSPTNQKDRCKSITYPSERTYLVERRSLPIPLDWKENSMIYFQQSPPTLPTLSQPAHCSANQDSTHKTKRNPLNKKKKQQFYRYDFGGFNSDPTSAELYGRSKSTRDLYNNSKIK